MALEEREATRDQHKAADLRISMPGKVVLHRFELVGSHDSIAR